jgi:pentatricopeptide repeat protein
MELLNEVWQSLGLEITIFAVTIISTLVLRWLLPKQGLPAKGKSQGNPNPVPSVCVPPQKQPLKRLPSSSSDEDNDLKTSRHQESKTCTAEPLEIYEEAIAALRDWQAGNTRSANRILALYAELRQSLASSHQTLAEATVNSRHKAVEFYSTLLQLVIRTGKQNLLEPIIDDMAKQGVPRTLSFYESVMKQLASQKLFGPALRIYDRLQQDGLEVSAVSCSCLVRFATEVGELQRATEFFTKLSSLTTPSIRAYMTILGVHNKRQDWPATVATIRDMHSKGVHVDSLTLNVALSTGIAAEQVSSVEALLAEAEHKEPFAPDVISYNTLTKVFAQRSMYADAAKVVDRMKKHNIRPNAITFNTVMDAAVRSGKFNEAWQLLTDMRSHGFRPDKFTCSILVKSISKCTASLSDATVKRALSLLEEVDSSLDHSLRANLYQSVADASIQADQTALLLKVTSQMRRYNVAMTPALQKSMVEALRREGVVA